MFLCKTKSKKLRKKLNSWVTRSSSGPGSYEQNPTGSLSLSVYILLAGADLEAFGSLSTHWELSDDSHFKLFWYQLCGELLFPWEHERPLGPAGPRPPHHQKDKQKTERTEGGEIKNHGRMMGRGKERTALSLLCGHTHSKNKYVK